MAAKERTEYAYNVINITYTTQPIVNNKINTELSPYHRPLSIDQYKRPTRA